MTVDAELGLVAVRRLVIERPRLRIPLLPGDRVTATPGSRLAAGDVVAERVRGVRLVEAPDARDGDGSAAGDAPEAGIWVAGATSRRGATPAGELLFTYGGLRRIATGPHPDLVTAPAAATVLEVNPGTEIVLEVDGCGIPGSAILGDPGHGPLALLTGDVDSRSALDVGRAGAIVVLPGRVDAETLTRARAMGIAGVVVPSLAERDRRDVVASEARQRAGLHRLTAFPILVLDGYVRRGMAGPVRDLLAALEGAEIGLAGHPPVILTALPSAALPRPEPDRVRVRGGSAAGLEGRFTGLAGPTRFASGIVLEAARVALDDGRTATVPLGDLERFA